MKDAIREIIGKTITGIVTATNDRSPQTRLFLGFADGTYFEFWGEFTCSGGVDKGDIKAAEAYARKFPGSTIRTFPENNRAGQ